MRAITIIILVLLASCKVTQPVVPGTSTQNYTITIRVADTRWVVTDLMHALSDEHILCNLNMQSADGGFFNRTEAMIMCNRVSRNQLNRIMNEVARCGGVIDISCTRTND